MEICGTFMQNAERGIWRKFLGLSCDRRDRWSPYIHSLWNNLGDFMPWRCS
jgi:hypothetical protein